VTSDPGFTGGGRPTATQGDRVRAARLAANLTRQQLSTAAGVPLDTVREIETSQNRSMREQTAVQIAVAISEGGDVRVSALWLIDGSSP
jgi:transcriptional regulator with XRE-family HTH domain